MDKIVMVFIAIFGAAFALYKYFVSLEKRITKVEAEVEDLSEIKGDIKSLVEQGIRNEEKLKYIHESVEEFKVRMEKNIDEDIKHKAEIHKEIETIKTGMIKNISVA